MVRFTPEDMGEGIIRPPFDAQAKGFKITNVHYNSPVEIRFTLEYKGIEKIRWIHVEEYANAGMVAAAMARNINHFVELVDTDSLRPYNSEEHVAGILRDAPRYGTD